jgi:hypothetical protein
MGLGDFRTALARLREAEALARTVQEPWHLGRVRSRMSYQLGSIGDLQGAVAAGEEAIELQAEQPNVRLRAGTHVVVSRAHYGLGDFRRALEIARRNDELAAQQSDPRLAEQVTGFSAVWAILAPAELGDFAASNARSAEAIRASTADAVLDRARGGRAREDRIGLAVRGVSRRDRRASTQHPGTRAARSAHPAPAARRPDTRAPWAADGSRHGELRRRPTTPRRLPHARTEETSCAGRTGLSKGVNLPSRPAIGTQVVLGCR